MSINIPDAHNKYFSRLVGHLNLNNLGVGQKKNIKKYIVESVGAQDNYYGHNAITKHIASDLWRQHVGPTHPHIVLRNDYDAKVVNYKAGSEIWKPIEEFLTMCLLLNDDHSVSQQHIRDEIEENLRELEGIKTRDPNETVDKYDFTLYGVGLLYQHRHGDKDYKSGYSEASYALLQKLKKQIKKFRIPVPEDNKAMKIANDIIEGNITNLELNYINSNGSIDDNEYYRLGG